MDAWVASRLRDWRVAFDALPPIVFATRSQHPNQNIVVIWDGAISHYSQQLKNYLSSINQNSSPDGRFFVSV
ncbi:MAG: hypothetical protein BRC38_06855 [Cyanobacteria bacterium QH_6_48_35]|nr:MAG: hypothetical protein BRC35_04000 [Cyanobacteria bacterium QH_10_48_56]PSO66057.1 MAG: hypothetical protein BRC38_06855 [Cyanobacteria bacterium QH_6_48_35]